MRILLISFIEDNRWTGMGKWTHHMAEGLEGLGHDVTLLFGDGFPFLWRKRRLATLLFPTVLAARLVRLKSRFDVVVIHEPSGFWYGVLRQVFSSLPPFIAMCHNVESKHFKVMLAAAKKGLAFTSRGMRIKVPLFHLWQSDGAIKLADHIVCLSTVDQDYVMKSLGCHPERVTSLINGVSSDNFSNSRLRSKARRVLFVGGWLDVKGRRLLPSIWLRVAAEFPDATLTLIGTGCSAEVVKQDFSIDVRDSIRVLPCIDTEAAMTAQYATHNMFLMPSLSEGSPLALLEAMSAALPVVASSVGGIKDILDDELNGLLFDPSSPVEGAGKVKRLLSDPCLAFRLGVAGQHRVRDLSWSAAARELDYVLQLTVTRNNRTTS